MNEAAWRQTIEKIAADLQRAELKSEPRRHRLEEGLARLWQAMQTSAGTIVRAYENLDEDAISRSAHARAAELGKAAFTKWLPTMGGTIEGIVKEVAIEIRALDQALSEDGRQERSDDPNRDYLAFGCPAVFILPRMRGPAPKGRRGQRFKRRGLIFHRLLPTEVDQPVRLYSPSVRGPGANGESALLLAAMFECVDLLLENDAGDFHVSGLRNEGDLLGAIDGQLQTILQEAECLAVVWPELTMTPVMQDAVSGALHANALSDTPTPALVMPGSWHRPQGPGGYANVAPVMTGFGTLLFDVVKRERFQLPTGSMENIIPGAEIPILMYGDVLVAFGICKDFCEGRDATPYASLDVDLILVPSYGNATTMDSHQAAAKALALNYGSRAFVVQQYLPEPEASQNVWGVRLDPAESAGKQPPKFNDQKKSLDHARFACTISLTKAS